MKQTVQRYLIRRHGLHGIGQGSVVYGQGSSHERDLSIYLSAEEDAKYFDFPSGKSNIFPERAIQAGPLSLYCCRGLTPVADTQYEWHRGLGHIYKIIRTGYLLNGLR